MSPENDPIDEFFEQTAAHVASDPEWRSELAASAREFRPGGKPTDDDAAAKRRHLEWFLLERTDAHGPELALERAVRCWMPDLESDGDDWISGLRQSHVGVLEVTGVQAGEGLWLRDLGGRGEFPVAEQAASRFVEVGDVIAGRLFPVGGGVHRLSSAAAFHRDARVLEALREDFERARTERRGVLRVGQREIESMFFGAPAEDVDAVADARRLLAESGVEPETIDLFLDELAQAPFDEDRLVHGAQDALSEILDDLAFESAVDIDAARRALLAAWAQLARRGPGDGPSLAPKPRDEGAVSPQIDVARAVERFEQRRKAGEPMTQLLDELERDLALGDDAERGTEPEGDPIQDFPGVVGAMVEEFLWEASVEGGAAAVERHANLRDLGRSAEAVGVFENLRARDLLVYAGWWLPENDGLVSADDARARIASLAAFCRWAETEHEVRLHAEFHETLARLGTSLPRIAEANQRRTRGARRDEGELFEILALGESGEGSARVRSRSGTEHQATIEVDLGRWLRPGDRLRGALRGESRLAVYCCYPPEIAELATSAAEGT